jgi:alkylated DNA repair dioxygenase AlkB
MRQIISQDGYAFLIEGFIPIDIAEDYYQFLLRELPWQEEHYTIYGKRVAAPRLVAWFGDPQAAYSYSGISHTPLPWLPLLAQLKTQIEQQSHQSFNSVLCNLYRDGQDSMGWHADKEPELGKNPYIASLSFGEARVFKLRHNKTKQTIDVVLENGALLLMGGELQHHWRHAVPKTAKVKTPRINLTFRKILI